MVDPAIHFDCFELLPNQRKLLQSGSAVRVGSRAFDILIALTARAGDIVSKEELIASVWPNLFVEETNLRVHIAALRKALGDTDGSPKFIANIPGRGYSFVASIAEKRASTAASPSSRRAVLPSSVQRLIGREGEVSEIFASFEERRLLTIVGPGGIGKTSVAVAVAKVAADRYADGAAFVDVAAINDVAFISSALANGLGLTSNPGDPLKEILAALKDRQMLIVLDSCEHLIDEAARLAASILASAAGVAILATSREPLRADGEWVHRLSPLQLAPCCDKITARDALTYPAIQLFVERAQACLGGFILKDEEALMVARICERLDGIALAIELAAGRVDTVGLEGLELSLNSALQVLTRGRRTALPRHQTLRATMDWSYHLLSEHEQEVFRALSVFRGNFTLELAHEALMADLAMADLEETIADLASKSLLVPGVSGRKPVFRMLDTTRAYGREKLSDSGEADGALRRHALSIQRLFARAEEEGETRDDGAWLDTYRGQLGNVRAALDWAFSPSGDPQVGIELTVAAVPVWFQLSLVDECLSRVQKAATYLGGQATDRMLRMRLDAVLGFPQMRAIAGWKTGAKAWQSVLDISTELGNVDYQLRALWALWVDATNHGHPLESLALAERFAESSERSQDPNDAILSDRFRARSHHLLGNQPEAHRLIARMLDRYVAPANRSHITRYQYDQRITAHITLERVLWVRGLVDRALEDIDANIASAQAFGHTLTLAHALSDGACPVALLAGDLSRAERFIGMLRELTREHALDVWKTYADGYAGDLLIRQGRTAEGIEHLKDCIARLRQSNFVLYLTAFLCSLASGLIHDNRPDEAEAMVDEALGIGAANGEMWLAPELYRIKAELSLIKAYPDCDDAAEAWLRKSQLLARGQGAASWELRSAVQLGRLRQKQLRPAEGLNGLTSVLSRFPVQSSLHDFQAAVGLAEELSSLVQR